MNSMKAIITSPSDVIKEAKDFLNVLSSNFKLVTTQCDNENLSIQPMEYLSFRDIFAELNIYAKTINQVPLPELDPIVKDFTTICNSQSKPFEEFVYSSEALLDILTYESDCDIGNVEKKMYQKFGELYLQKINSLLDELVCNNFEQYWHYLFKLRSFSQIEDFLDKKDQVMNIGQRKICSFYYALMIRVRDNFFDVNELQNTYEIENGEQIEIHAWMTKSKTGAIPNTILTNDPNHTQLQIFLDILKSKISKFQSKITFWGSRDIFLEGLKKITVEKDLNKLPLFIENNFHFSYHDWTKKMQEHSLPEVMASKIAVLLRLHFEETVVKMLNNETTKTDLILWLACEFYGIRGFKLGSVKGYLERTYLSENHKKTGNTIVKAFQKKLNQKKPN
jgi:hypothetical protein